MKYVIANWKMHLGIRESAALARNVLRGIRGMENMPEIVICPSFTSLSEVRKVLGRSRIHVGAQNAGPDTVGSYTGEVSAAMLKDVGSEYAIIGHSERRLLGESDELIGRRLQAVVEGGLTPILCVGESEEVRYAGGALDFVKEQLKQDLDGLKLTRHQDIFIAYEPVWAIGTGRQASVGDIVDMHAHIRAVVLNILDADEDRVHVLYGGSVDEEHAYELLRESEIDGVLVGGASLKLNQFKAIIDAGHEVIEAQTL